MNGWRVEGFSELRELGAGAQGRVVLAVPEGHDVQVAIKYLAPALLADEQSLTVFRREAETLVRVANPHVARLYRYVEGPQGAAIVMEAVTGASLREVLDGHRRQSGGGLTPEAALVVLKGSLLGLAAAHSVGVVHRDYKPANVVVQPDGASKLIDFGIAVLSGQSSRAGTPAYMSPEQWQGNPASPATDLYAASCVFYECLTGAKPYRGGSTAQLMSQHLNAPVPFQDVPEPVRPLLARGMAKNPGQRLWNAGEFVAELERNAVAAYGPDWEQRGVRALAVAVAALASAVPFAMLGSFAAESAAPAAPGAVSSLQQSAVAHSAQAARHSRGFLRRMGGTKAAVGAAAVVTAAAAVTGTVIIRGQRSGAETEVSPKPGAGGGSPTPTTVGGQATGALRGGFRNPAPFGSAQGPTLGYDFTVKPARVKAGSRISIGVRGVLRSPPGDHELGLGRTGSERMAFYPVPPAAEGTLPTGEGTAVPSKVDVGDQQNNPAPGDWSITTVSLTYTATVPANGTLKPGRYLVSSFVPPTWGLIEIDGRRVTPASVGAYTQGSLPVITVLPGSAAQPTTSGPTPRPTTSRAGPCPTYTRPDGTKIIRCD